MEYIKVKKGDEIVLELTINIDDKNIYSVKKTITFMRDKTINKQKLHRKHFKELSNKIQKLIDKEKVQKSKSSLHNNINNTDLEK